MGPASLKSNLVSLQGRGLRGWWDEIEDFGSFIRKGLNVDPLAKLRKPIHCTSAGITG